MKLPNPQQFTKKKHLINTPKQRAPLEKFHIPYANIKTNTKYEIEQIELPSPH